MCFDDFFHIRTKVDDFFHIYICYYRTNIHQRLMLSTGAFPNCCFVA